MSFVTDIDPMPIHRPIVRARTPVEPPQPVALDEHRLRDPDEFIPGRVAFSDFLSRENVFARFADAGDAQRPEQTGPREAPDDGTRNAADRGPGGWPRLGDVPDERRTIERTIEKTYKFEQLEPAGTRIDVYR